MQGEGRKDDILTFLKCSIISKNIEIFIFLTLCHEWCEYCKRSNFHMIDFLFYFCYLSACIVSIGLTSKYYIKISALYHGK